MPTAAIIVFDVETTGTDYRRDQVIELCVQYGLGQDATNRVWRIRPSVSIHPEAQAVHGISMEDLADCPGFAEVADEVRAVFVDAEVLVGYNLSFDIAMLQAEFDRLGQIFDLRDKQVVDPFRLWQQCEPRSLQHAHLRFVGDSFAEAHSAAADVAATGRVLEGMLDSFGLADQDWDSIATVCEPERATWIGPSRHLRWSEDGRPLLGFGKHARKPIDTLARSEDSDYLRWVLSKDFPAHVHDICARALELPGEGFLDWLQATYGSAPAPAGPDDDGLLRPGVRATAPARPTPPPAPPAPPSAPGARDRQPPEPAWTEPAPTVEAPPAAAADARAGAAQTAIGPASEQPASAPADAASAVATEEDSVATGASKRKRSSSKRRVRAKTPSLTLEMPWAAPNWRP